jgi:hypothetical protein
MLRRIPLGRFAECEDVPSVVCLLLSDAAAMLKWIGSSDRWRLSGDLMRFSRKKPCVKSN